ncbi:sterile alpha motif domain-containing protein aveugle [Amblyomma americanum]|uniref:SAM domain-containing protein n=1 Tax=Amblyomma americanum TaxID=6943 RepID=A0A0C9SC28_AMBAM
MAKHRQAEPTAPPSPATADKEKEAQRKRARPLPVFFWETVHVMKWMKRCCINHYTSYSTLFLDHEITGRSLVRLNDVSLEKMGIKDPNHRDELYREILKLKLKSNILEMRDLESKGTEFSTVGMS